MTTNSDRRSSPSGVAPTSDSPANRPPAEHGPERPDAREHREEQTSPAASRLRQEIDHGRAGDEVDVEDPLAVPLGSDGEAAGHPPTPNEVAAALDREQRSVRPADRSATSRGIPPWLLLSFLAVAAVIALLAYFG